MKVIYFCAIAATLLSSSAFALDDFKILQTRRSQTLAAVTDCRKNIEDVICFVDPEIDDGKMHDPADRKCLPASKSYAAPLQALFDVYPSHLQEMFCHLRYIFIEKDFIGSAYGGIVEDLHHPETILGGILGIREGFFSTPVTLDQWASWKEQIHYGTSADSVATQPGLPMVRTNAKRGQIDMLYFLVTHEFGHIFDFTNKLNDYEKCADRSGDKCRPLPGKWAELSWQFRMVPKPENEFTLRKDLCFYFCEGKFIPANRQDEVYGALSKTTFLTPYTTRYPEEDFADSFALYNMQKEMGLRYSLVSATGKEIDVTARLQSPDLKGKREYIEKFLNSKYSYPP